jgi:hypothetical protein
MEVVSTPNISMKYMHFLLYIPAVLPSKLEQRWVPCLAVFHLLVNA